MTSPVARIFLSSTFRDFGEERDLLVRRVFPALRARLKERFVELVDVDLRWGITTEQAERGEVLPICLAEIDRARPWFVGLLGDRYGWVPEADVYDPDLVEQRPWLDEHRGGKSVTELEILHGVLNDPAMAGRALFYFRDPAYARQKGGEYVSASSEDAVKLEDLKDRIRASGFPVVEGYPTPEALADRLEADLWAVLDEAFPAEDVPAPFAREQRRHEAYAEPRRRLYLGGQRYLATLDEVLDQGAQRILIDGRSGGGKSALLANWLSAHHQTHPDDVIHQHFLSASSDAADVASLVGRLIEAIRRQTGDPTEIPLDPQDLLYSLPEWLRLASAWASVEGKRWVILLDGLNGLRQLPDLRASWNLNWFPEFLPERVHVVISCLPGSVHDALATKGEWRQLTVEPLTNPEAQTLLRRFLGQYNKVLSGDLESTVLAHPLATNPLFLLTLAEELRLFGVHEELAERIGHYLTTRTVDNLFARVLERVEGDCGREAVRTTMEGIFASRSGLSDEEILDFTGLVPATLAHIRYALDLALQESGGRLTFAHDYLRIAVADRYLGDDSSLEPATASAEAITLRQALHRRLAEWFATRPFDERVAEELPYQWAQANDWEELAKCLTERAVFEPARKISIYELRSYWLNIEWHTDVRIETAYEVAWDRWRPDPRMLETAALAGELYQFMRSKRPTADFTQKLLEQIFAINTEALGSEHPDTLTSSDNLAILLGRRGDYEGALRLHRRTLFIRQNALGPEHPSTCINLKWLGYVLRKIGDDAAAESMFRRALAIAEAPLGPAHPETEPVLEHFANFLVERERWEDAEPLQRKILEIEEAVYGPESSMSAHNLESLGFTLCKIGRFEEAELCLKKALEFYAKSGDDFLHEMAEALSQIGILYAKSCRPDEARIAFIRCLDILKSLPDHDKELMRRSDQYLQDLD